ncbi:hypothetical protein PsYK624_153490 [Phanerochaete sordida]|uniref:Uncharacterized protein n=1 Tax=Phanerochaete sordida TaxID=48140 RepID=A0A9P3LKY0_9APHY|nr:hypothetical protein PsYK624_153490 [Phanerochaete sordida]
MLDAGAIWKPTGCARGELDDGSQVMVLNEGGDPGMMSASRLKKTAIAALAFKTQAHLPQPHDTHAECSFIYSAPPVAAP